MSLISNIKNRAGLITFLSFALLALVITFGLALLDSGAHASGDEGGQQVKTSKPEGRKGVEETLRLIELEFSNYQAQVGENSPAGWEMQSQVKSFIGELLAQLQELRNDISNSDLSPGDALEINNRITLLAEKMKRQERITFGNWLAKQSKPVGIKLPDAKTATGAISGTITDSDTSAPLENVAVEIFNSSGNFITAGFTDSSGFYTSPDVLASGTYYAFTINSSGYLDELYNDIDCSLLNCDPTTGTPISVTDGETTTGIDFALAPGGRISGTITDASTSAPLVSVSVQIFDSNGFQVSDGFTDSKGNYISRRGLPTGTYYVRTSNSSGYIDELYDNINCVGCTVTAGTPISVTVGSTTSGVDFALETGGLISGAITDAATSDPLNAFIQIYNASGVFVTFSILTEPGSYRSAAGLTTGSYYARTFNSLGYINELYDNIPCITNCGVTSGTAIPVTVGATTSGIDFALDAGGRISGTITDAATGTAIQGAFVRIFNSSGVQVSSAGIDSLGSYTTGTGLAAGTYYARTSNSQGYIDELYDNIVCTNCNATTGTPITVTAGATTTGIDFALTPGGHISGTVTDAATSAPLANAGVQIYNSSGEIVTDSLTNSVGSYVFNTGLPAGTYYARTFNDASYINELYNNITCLSSCTVTTGTPITVTAGATTSGIDFSLAPGGRISGTVTSAANSAPLANVTVDIFNSSGAFITGSITNGSGSYVTTLGLLPGTYYARTFNSDGYVDELYDNIVCVNCNATTGTPITVTAGATTSGIDFALAAGGRISGTITDDATSAPLANVSVFIFNSAGNFVTSGFTDASGNYTSFGGLLAGTYYAQTFNSSGYINELYNNIPCPGCNVTTGTPITVTAGATTAGINFALSSGSRISGTVTDAVTSAPLASITVQIYDSGGTVVTSGFTNSSGNYISDGGLTAGTYYARTFNSRGYVNEIYDNIACLASCNPTTGTPITVTAGATTSGINFALTLGGRISGTVTDAATSAPLANVTVQIYDSSGVVIAAGFTNSVGSYISNSGLPAGTYYARTFNSQGYVNELYNNIPCSNCNVTTGTPITVTAGATTSGINFALTPSGRISGTVTDAATSAPLANVTVQIYNSSGVFVTSGVTNSSGSYTVNNITTSGAYYARTFNSSGYINELYDNIGCVTGCTVTTGTPITVTAGATTPGINFVLTAGGRVSGTVTDAASSAPLADVNVEIYNSSGLFVTFVFTNSVGSYISDAGLPAGTYYARTTNSQGYVNELYNNIPCSNCNVTVGTPITVTAGTTTSGINFALAAGGRISGRVTDAATSAPLSNVTVQIYNSSGAFITSGSTNSAGNYISFDGFPAGTYYARTFNSQGYVNELYNNISCLTSCSVTTGTPITATAGSTTSGIDFTLTPGGRISGTVTDSLTSAPLANVTVQIYNSSGLFVTLGFTNSLGNYTSDSSLPAGTYYARTFNSQGYINELYNNVNCVVSCTVITGTPITVTAGATTSGIDFALAQGGRVSGTVTDAATSAPLASVIVQISDSSGLFVASTVTNSLGNYVSNNALPTGTYYAQTFNSQGYIDEVYNNIPCLSCNVTTGTPITVTAGATTSGIDFALAPGGRISGTVTEAVTDAPLANVTVGIYDSSGVAVTEGFTDSSGNYISEAGLPAGTYYAQTFNSQGYIDELYNNIACAFGCTVTTGTSITVTAGSTTSGINFALAVGGHISGTVTDAVTSAPLANVNVQISDSSGLFVASGFTNSAGTYVSSAGLPAGTYYARTFNSSGYIDESYNDINCAPCLVTSGTPITVASGSTTSGINFALAVGGRVSGTVTDGVTAAPIANINVSIINVNGVGVASARTNASGSYLLSTGLPTGTYYARATNSLGYINEVYNDIQCVNCNTTSGAPINVTAGSTTSGIDFALTPGGRISGTVTNAATSAPLQGHTVQIFNSGGVIIASAFTNSSGVYTTTVGLPTGTYFARTSSDTGFVNKLYNNVACTACAVTSGMPITVTAGSTTTGINFALDVGGRISGRVTDSATSAPLANIEIDIYDGCGQLVTFGFTDGAGNYTTFSGLPTGTYYVLTFNFAGYIDEAYNNIACVRCSVTSGNPVTVTSGATTTGINFALARGTRISGTVTDSATSAKISNIGINILDATGTLVDSVVTNLSGVYVSRSLPPGTYYAGTSNSIGYVNEIYNNILCPGCSAFSGTPITLTTGSDRSGIDFSLDRGGRIFGTVTNAATSAPLPNIVVQIYNSAGTPLTSVATDTSGNFISRGGLPTGTYYVRTSNSLGFVDKLYDNITCAGCAVTSGTPVSVTTGSTTSGINLALDTGGLISGTVTNVATGAPLIGVTVEIYNSKGALVNTSLTDCSGNYISSAGLPTGTYYARTVNSQGFIDGLYNNMNCVSCDPTTGTAIAVTSGQTTAAINFSLCPFSISPDNNAFPSAGGEGLINVTSGCGWTAVSGASWIEITSEASGSGNGTVSYAVRDNPGVEPRTGTITIANRTFTIQQAGQAAGSCSVAISPILANYNAAGGTGNISVTADAQCAWQAVSNASWIVVISGCCGTGNGNVTYAVEPNATGTTRTGKITIGGQKFNVKQSAN